MSNPIVGLSGYVGYLETKTIPTQTGPVKVLTFTVATKKNVLNISTGQREDITQWNKCVCIGAYAEKVLIPYMKKGDFFSTHTGELIFSNWINKTTGDREYGSEIRITEGNFISPMKREEQNPPESENPAPIAEKKASATRKTQPQYQANDLDDDLPF